MSHQLGIIECLVSPVLDRSMADKLTDQEDSRSLLTIIGVLLALEKLGRATTNLAVPGKQQKVKWIMWSILRAPKKHWRT